MPLSTVDKLSEQFASDLDIVIGDLIRRVTNFVGGAGGAIDAAILLNSQEFLFQALRDAGYYELAAKHAAGYEQIAEAALARLEAEGYPAAQFSTVDAQALEQLAAANVEGFIGLGESTMDELRLSLFRNQLTGIGFDALVNEIRDTLDGNLKRYAYTYANTANLNFNGEVWRIYGEQLGANRWEVLGPLDEKTRDVCRAALSRPVRTKEQWMAASYFGGTPGGYNCRHQMRPVFD